MLESQARSVTTCPCTLLPAVELHQEQPTITSPDALAGVDTELVRQMIRVAFHEAGHAFVTRRVGLQVCHVTMSYSLWSEMSHPHMRILRIPPHFNPVNYGMLCLAGPLAQSKVYGESLDDARGNGCDTDYILALDAVGPEHIDAVLRFTQRYIDEGWPSIGRLAVALIRHKTLRGPDVERILNFGQGA